MRKIIALTLVTVVVSLASCLNETRLDNNQQKVINTTISVDDFEEKLVKNPSVQLVDVRSEDEYNQGHLTSALNYDINSSDFEKKILTLNKTQAVLVYCLSGGRSATAASLMAEKGFLELYNMQGGILKWNASNKPLSGASNNPAADGLTMAGFNALLETDKYVLVDYNAKWCKPCKKMAPMLEVFSEARKEKLSLLKIDADENKKLLTEKRIESLPVLELYKNGKLIWKHEGFIDEKSLINATKL